MKTRLGQGRAGFRVFKVRLAYGKRQTDFISRGCCARKTLNISALISVLVPSAKLMFTGWKPISKVS